MPRLLSAEEMREIESAAMDSGSVTGRALMERAGQGAVAAALSRWPDLASRAHRAVILCGPGNNGGDGFVVARLLAGRGWEVRVLLMGDPAGLPPDARANHDLWAGIGPVEEMTQAVRDKPDLVVDAIFGTGLSRPFEAEGITAALADMAEGEAVRVLALDMPSGWCSDSGRWLGEGITPTRANLTVAFHAAKRGHYLGDAPEACGALAVVEIGLDESEAGVSLVSAPPARRLMKQGGHKYGYGHALILGGGVGKGGAARMAARGALRIGAGLVTLAVPGAALQENAARLDAVMLTRMNDVRDLAEILEDDRLNALCLGPGLGHGGGTRALVHAALEVERPVVLDADAMTSFEEDPEELFDALHLGVVLTPHMGEFARLFPDLAAPLKESPEAGPAYSRLDAARLAAERAGCTILLKGPDTIIANAESAALHGAFYDRAAPWLATAGAGDTLAGFITGLLARDDDPFFAATAATWLHADCARDFGPGLIAEDLPERLPRVLARLA
ncbi:yjeF C-terminal region, hydroxyethylthiazole kinase-related/yjeF N-terminal region [Palleronia marisminoris]|uniref:Bifunctional NAD(P)H-hydrate repair enzyme n=1 Tax=Palleronia marisminoris TaxID=315423 RepID=A0A1Y5RJV8_9RHOB|nr:NAD(P)H-hydrate dehydratase [Palleronia marisminoris]SFG16851.1 yjeF C-terminal region, hydroxyethylthiazole kinase-related/yjeF N-terminal region [Palleronia marisminoris]SLN16455.1 Bifunctional NAD(P)H-hydrate repair enzyme Nnr [Palleronia marisminoris]